jgi:hypothetical protein
MKIHLYALCWNDADMLPFFFRHYDWLVSRYFIFDDCSTDGSLDLLHSHPNVEVKPFVRSDPGSFTLSELSISDECWKRSRGCADWVIVIDIDEHVFHPDLPALLRRYQAFGITIVPALGYQMISEEFPRSDALLCQTCTQGAPWRRYSKLTFFDPAAITETNYGVGRHVASPIGRVIAPARDELLLLHYKYLGFERTHARLRRQRNGLRSKDTDNGWGKMYGWSEGELRHAWDRFAGSVIDVRTDAAVANYPIPRWWDPFRSLATPPRVQAPIIHRQIEEEPKQGGISCGTANSRQRRRRGDLFRLILGTRLLLPIGVDRARALRVLALRSAAATPLRRARHALRLFLFRLLSSQRPAWARHGRLRRRHLEN